MIRIAKRAAYAALWLLSLGGAAGATCPYTGNTSGVDASAMVSALNDICASTATQFPLGATPVTGPGAGSTGAVVGTLAGTSGKTTYLCGWDISAVGGTAAVGPVTVAGTKGGSMVYQMNSAAIPVRDQHSYYPCIPASAANTVITVTTTADGTATAVDVNSWGYQL